MDNIKSFRYQVLDPVLKSILTFPERNAFCINEVNFTYQQFGNFIINIRNCLQQIDNKEIYIGLVVNDDIFTYASIFALWLEGKAYVPLHPNQPIDRSSEIIVDMGIHYILDSTQESKFSSFQVIPTFELKFPSHPIYENPKIVEEESIAYILFTSGSTGKPKGVTISRKNLAAFMGSFWDSNISIDENDRCLQCFDLTFDVSIQSFLVPLCKGASVYTIPHDQIKYSYVFGLLEDHRLTMGAMAPSMLRYLKPYFDEIDLPDMKYCIVTAEASPIDLIEKWLVCIPNAQVFNFYGPTEATIYCTYYQIQRHTENATLNGMLSIGKTMKNVNSIIVDDGLNIVSKGEKGELCVSGDQITPGYWANPEKNAHSFFDKEINGIQQRFYHTGDLCYLNDEEQIMLFGRLDSQAKIQGYRVEIGEIEFHVRKYLEGNNAVIITFESENGNTELALFIEINILDTTQLMDYLKTKLPFYMIPTKVFLENEFVLNSNGKVDKKILKEKLQNNVKTNNY